MAKTDQNQDNRFEEIIRDIKLRILNREWPAGSRIPTRVELEKRYQASSRTLQKSLTRLIEEEFIYTRGRKGGSFVSDAPPCHSRIAMLFHSKLNHWWPQDIFLQKIYTEAQRLGPEIGITFEFFHGFSNFRNFSTFFKLTNDLLAHRYAGVIFTSPPFQLEGTELLESPEIIRAGAMTQPHTPHIPKVAPEHSFLDRATERLASLGCKKPVLLSLGGSDVVGKFKAKCEENGMIYDPRRCHIQSRTFVEWSKHTLQTVLSMPPNLAPDSLILGDDLLIPLIDETLTAHGITSGTAFPIVALCNYPITYQPTNKMMHLGSDTDKWLELLVKFIRDQQNGFEVPMFTALPTLFEDEYEATKE